MAKTVKPLTNTQVDKAKPLDKPYTLTDGGGLYLHISEPPRLYRRLICLSQAASPNRLRLS